MVNHATFSAWPTMCEDCLSVTTANFKHSPLVCLDCGGEKVTPLFTDDELNIIKNWGPPTGSNYSCPKCKESSLAFEAGGMMWD